jgi:hypothetical protein
MREKGLARYAPLAGVAFFVLTVVTIVLSNESPDSDDSTAKVVEYWTDNEDSEVAAAFVATFASFFFLWFAGSVRATVARVEAAGGRLATLLFGGAVLSAAGLMTNNAIQFTVAETAGEVPPDVTQTLSVLYADFFFPISMGIAIFLLASGIAALSYGALPRWLGWAAVVLGVLIVTPVWFVGLFGSVLWVLVVSVLLFRAAGGPAEPGEPTATAEASPS